MLQVASSTIHHLIFFLDTKGSLHDQIHPSTDAFLLLPLIPRPRTESAS